MVLKCNEELFKATSLTPLKSGWKRALSMIYQQEEIRDKQQPIPALQENTLLGQGSEQILIKNTKPPLYYTEDTLIEAMKSIA